MNYVLFRNFISNCKCKWHNDIVLLKDWFSIDPGIRSQANYNYAFQKWTQMVNTKNGKYFRINITKPEIITKINEPW